jgi:hypothetical protein
MEAETGFATLLIPEDDPQFGAKDLELLVLGLDTSKVWSMTAWSTLMLDLPLRFAPLQPARIVAQHLAWEVRFWAGVRAQARHRAPARHLAKRCRRTRPPAGRSNEVARGEAARRDESARREEAPPLCDGSSRSRSGSESERDSESLGASASEDSEALSDQSSPGASTAGEEEPARAAGMPDIVADIMDEDLPELGHLGAGLDLARADSPPSDDTDMADLPPSDYDSDPGRAPRSFRPGKGWHYVEVLGGCIVVDSKRTQLHAHCDNPAHGKCHFHKVGQQAQSDGGYALAVKGDTKQQKQAERLRIAEVAKTRQGKTMCRHQPWLCILCRGRVVHSLSWQEQGSNCRL